MAEGIIGSLSLMYRRMPMNRKGAPCALLSEGVKEDEVDESKSLK
jgi:hypothetical protein